MTAPAAAMFGARAHGGPGAHGAARWDFSTNANAAGPCPSALQAVRQADPSRYPDPDYHALRERLAAWHGVAPQRVLLAASASEFIQRMTAVSGRLAPGAVALPLHAYGDYAVAAHACGRHTVVEREPAACGRPATHAVTLRWCTDPGSPLGQAAPPPDDLDRTTTVLDSAYAPLRLQGTPAWSRDAKDRAFEVHSPNKALGLTGVRGAYVLAPADTTAPHQQLVAALRAAEPSWPLGAHAVALLTAWTEPETQQWLAQSLSVLRGWTHELRSGLQALGLAPQPSVTPFLCARRPAAASADWLRERGLAVRCTASFGLPGQMRVSAQPPEATAALLQAMADALRLPDHTPDSEESTP
ncbi:MAG: aminotransferase class I/II-fold pyridoxal phosphate-dependent enzyme [Roseateles sp.]